MLNQTKSNIKNIWKYFVILPALALFLMSFNVETIEVEKPSINLAPLSINNNPLSILNFEQETIQKKIDKNTTDSELKDISESLKKNGISFSYKNVKRNDKSEIIGIDITYKDYQGNTGNYSLISESPINTFYFFKEENGSIGFKSENVHTKQRFRIVEDVELEVMDEEEMEEVREERIKEREERIAKRQALNEQRRLEIEERIEKAREEHEKAREEHKIIIKERMKIHDSLRNKHSNIFIIKDKDHEGDNLFFSKENNALFIIDDEESNAQTAQSLSPNSIANIDILKGEHALKTYGDKGKDGVIVIQTKPQDENHFIYKFKDDKNESNVEGMADSNIELEWISKGHNVEVKVINKKTTNAELNRMKSDLKKQNIDFKYSKLKRNKEGEITRIKISLNDNQGNKSSSTFDKGSTGISHVLVGKSNQNLIIKSI